MLQALALLVSLVGAAEFEAAAPPVLPTPLPALASLPTPRLPAAPEVAASDVLAALAALPSRASLEILGAALRDPHGAAPETLLANFWDAPRAGGASSFLSSPDFEAAKPAGARLAEIAEAAHASPTARRVLRAYADHARKAAAVPVRFRALGTDHGQYDYTKGVLTLDTRYRDGPAVEAVPTLVHELLHVLQHAQGLPAEALEMELEAHAVTLVVMKELGLEAGGAKDFSRAALEKLRQSPKAYVDWMAEQLPGKYRLIGSDLETVRDDLETEVAELEQKEGPRAAARLQWVERDLSIVRSKKGAATYRAYAARVARLLRKLSRSL